MASYIATVEWTLREGDAFDKGRYSRAHQIYFDGGAVVAGSPSAHSVPLPWSDPVGVDPEEAFVASISACHMLWFLDLARRDGWRIERYRDEAQGEMTQADGRWAITLVTLRPVVDFEAAEPTQAELNALHHRAHEACYIANSVRSEIRIEPAAAAHPIRG
jgi:organic hydroperoxide reductase OsmC/OhrA